MDSKNEEMCQKVNFDDVIAIVSKHTNPNDNIHGLEHSQRVERNVLLLSNPTINVLVARLFAYFHDACRSSCTNRPKYIESSSNMKKLEQERMCEAEHGVKAAQLVKTLRNSLLKSLSDKEIEMLAKACELHTTTLRTGDPTIDICFDADRLDLWRCGVVPRPGKMATSIGAYYANNINVIIDKESKICFSQSKIEMPTNKRFALRISNINKSEMFMGRDWDFNAKSVEANAPGIYAVDLPMLEMGFDWYFRLLIAQSMNPDNIRIILLEYAPTDVVLCSRADEISLKRANICKTFNLQQYLKMCQYSNGCFDAEYTRQMIVSSLESSCLMLQGKKNEWVESMVNAKKEMRNHIAKCLPFPIEKILHYEFDELQERISMAHIYDKIMIMYADRDGNRNGELINEWRKK
jgi:uncharacterized protein